MVVVILCLFVFKQKGQFNRLMLILFNFMITIPVRGCDFIILVAIIVFKK